MLIHIGVGSESLMGEAFKIHHKEGAVVKAGAGYAVIRDPVGVCLALEARG